MEGTYKYKYPLKDFLRYIYGYGKEYLIHLNHSKTSY